MILTYVSRVDSASSTHTLLRRYRGMFLQCLLPCTHRLYLQRHRNQLQMAYITSPLPLHHATFLHHIHIPPSRSRPTITRPCFHHIYPTLPPLTAPHLYPPSLRPLLTHRTHTKHQNISFTRTILQTSRRKHAHKVAHLLIGWDTLGMTPIRWKSRLHRQMVITMTTMWVTQWKSNLPHQYQNIGDELPTTPRKVQVSNSAANYPSALARNTPNGVFLCLVMERRFISSRCLPLTKCPVPTRRHHSSAYNLRVRIVHQLQRRSLSMVIHVRMPRLSRKRQNDNCAKQKSNAAQWQNGR